MWLSQYEKLMHGRWSSVKTNKNNKCKLKFEEIILPGHWFFSFGLSLNLIKTLISDDKGTFLLPSYNLLYQIKYVFIYYIAIVRINNGKWMYNFRCLSSNIQSMNRWKLPFSHNFSHTCILRNTIFHWTDVLS